LNFVDGLTVFHEKRVTDLFVAMSQRLR